MKGFLLCIACFLALIPNTKAAGQARADHDGAKAAHLLYLETNDFHPGKNAILAYRIDPADGNLSLVGTFPTRGTGHQNFDVRLGPDDHDKEVILSPDKRFLLAVNGGSDTVAVFRVEEDGSLTHVEGSPFPSHGLTPTSLGMTGDKLFVVNANNDNTVGGTPNETPANYTAFHFSENGRMEHIAGSSVELAANANPTQVAISNDGKYVFGIDFFAVDYPGGRIFPFLPDRGSLIESFQVQKDGTMRRAAGGPYRPSPASRVEPSNAATGYVLGLYTHPTKPILYAGELLTAKLGVFTYDSEGRLTSTADVDSLGLATCWITSDPEARWLYTADAATNSIGVWDLSNPLQPVTIQELPLRLASGPMPPAIAPALFPTLPFQLSVDPTGRFLYVTNHAAAATDYMVGNMLHIMQIGRDGTLTEPEFSPMQLPVDGNVRPTGNAIR